MESLYEHFSRLKVGLYKYPLGDTYGDFEIRLTHGDCPEQRKREAERLKDDNAVVMGICKICGRETKATISELKNGLRTTCKLCHLKQKPEEIQYYFLLEDLMMNLFKDNKLTTVYCSECGAQFKVAGNYNKKLSLCCNAPFTVNEKAVFANWVKVEKQFYKDYVEE